ncbi:TerD family protein [Streptomyces sp. CC210A]|uniref:TerD family protein n=1 Tax=Streptomyces sp. CC210A TaxID=2898184 RepID=UPI0035A8D3FF
MGGRSGEGVPDADASALLLVSGKVRSDADFVFRHQVAHPSNSVRHDGKRASGGAVTGAPSTPPPLSSRRRSAPSWRPRPRRHLRPRTGTAPPRRRRGGRTAAARPGSRRATAETVRPGPAPRRK